MADSLYQKICKERCEWCRKEWKTYGLSERRHRRPGATDPYNDPRCKRPSMETVIEEQSSEIEVLKQVIADLKEEARRG